MRRLFAAADVDYDQWKALTIVALKLDFRTSSLGRSQFRRDASIVAAVIGQLIFYTLIGLAIAAFVWFSRDLFLVGTVAMTYVMFVVGMAVLVDHNSALASPSDYAILGFRPVTSRTYFAVRLTKRRGCRWCRCSFGMARPSVRPASPRSTPVRSRPRWRS